VEAVFILCETVVSLTASLSFSFEKLTDYDFKAGAKGRLPLPGKYIKRGK